MRVFDTLSGAKNALEPRNGTITMYVCGITPYSEPHLGHAMSVVIFDVIRRYLEYRGYPVYHVQNFTDVDDKIIERAREEGLSTDEVAERNIRRFYEDMDALNVRRAHAYPRPTEEIPTILEIIGRLVDTGYAYAADGDVYFRADRFPDYGKLSHRTVGELSTIARVESSPHKEKPMDFTLWKAAKAGEPSWESPWGPGRPGWHIECSAMCVAYLGDSIDIHGGGRDLIFPHHENEIAQTESYTGVQPAVRFWVHNGLLQLQEEKMSKSLGNLITVRHARDRYSADAVRLFFLSSHYRSPLAYSEEAIAAQERAVERLRRAVEPTGAPDGTGAAVDPSPFRRRFVESMDDDFNTPQALAALFDLAREINRGREQGAEVEEARATVLELAGVLGLTLEQGDEGRAASAKPFIDLLVEVRNELRSSRQFVLADSIRDRMRELGILIEDSPQGTQWRQRASDGVGHE